MSGVLIPTVCVLAAALLGAERGRVRGGLGVRGAVLLGMLATGVWAAAGGEILGFFGAFRAGAVVAWWGVPAAVLALAVARKRAALRGWLRRGRLDWGSRWMIAVTAALLLVTGYAAARLPTNTWDCWTYHLPRQVYWVQQGSLAHFPSHDLRALEMPPFAEVLGAHWMLLSGGDGWSNMGQWFALLGCVLAASLIAKVFGAGARGQSLAALLVATNPGTIVQAMNGKNDIVVALWILILAWLGARAWRERSCGWVWAAAMGAALGLALYTKGTGYIVALPVCLALGAGILRLQGVRGIATGAVIVLAAVAINAGHWQRNLEQFGSPLGLPASKGGYKVRAETLRPRAIVSGVIKNTAAHAALPGLEKLSSPRMAESAPEGVRRVLEAGDRCNLAVTGWVGAAHGALGFEVNDPRTNSLTEYPYEVASKFTEDGNSTSPAHVGIGVLLLGIAAVRPRAVRGTVGWVAFCVPFAAWVCFAALLRWQPWQFRLEIPIFALLAPVAGSVLPRVRLPVVKDVLVGLAVIVALGALAFNNARPLVGAGSVLVVEPEAAEWETAHWIEGPMRQVEAKLRELDPASVGHALALSPYEYGIIRAAKRGAGRETVVFPLVPNRGPREVPVPEVVVAFDEKSAGPMVQPCSGAWFTPVAECPPFTIYLRAEAAAALPATDLPKFYGWRHAEGLDKAEGPYPQFDLPVVRWAREKKTVLAFDCPEDGACGRELVMECRRNDRTDQAMTVRLNGAEVYRFEFGRGFLFFPHRVGLDCAPGKNVLEIEYASVQEGANPRAVLYRRLQILPVAAERAGPPPPP